MIGGGLDGFIGAVHRKAAALDGEIELVAGVFSGDQTKNLEAGNAIGLQRSRVYRDYVELIEKEKSLPSSQKADFISIVTPNYLHFAPARAALLNGFHVLSEKPLGISLEESLELQKILDQTTLIFGLTHNYSAYPMVKQAKAIIADGRLGKLRKVLVEYPQGWLSKNIEQEGQKQASWRTDPGKAGISCCVGDIGTHAENLLEYITGLRIKEVSADISTFVDGRLLEDDATIMIRMQDGVKGVIIATQVAAGEENELKIRVYGEKAGIEWLQSSPNALYYKPVDSPVQIFKTGSGNSYLSKHALAHTRLPGGHPEGYIESLANIYRNFAMAIQAKRKGTEYDQAIYDFPGIEEGVRGMKFINAVIESGKNNSQWFSL